MRTSLKIVLVILWGAVLGVAIAGMKLLLKVPDDSLWSGVIMGGVIGFGVVGGIALLNALTKRHPPQRQQKN